MIQNENCLPHYWRRRMAAKWDTIESDPAVFSTLIEDLGVAGVSIQELWSLDDLPETNCFGLLFLHKFVKGGAKPQHTEPHGTSTPPWFALQTVSNACGTQALLHILLNSGLVLGDTLQNFKEFTSSLPPSDRGSCFEECDAIRLSHNSFARPEPFIREERVAKRGEKGRTPFHFIAYTPLDGYVYELDGLAPRPICLGPVPPSGLPWLTVAQTAIQTRMSSYLGGELRFTLLAVVEDARLSLRFEAARCARDLGDVYGLLLSLGCQDGIETPEELLKCLGFTPASDCRGEEALGDQTNGIGEGGAQYLTLRYAQIKLKLEILAEQWRGEAEKRDRWAKENAQRRHNFIPFIFQLLKGLADKGALSEELEKAVARNKARLERAKAEGRDPSENEDD